MVRIRGRGLPPPRAPQVEAAVLAGGLLAVSILAGCLGGEGAPGGPPDPARTGSRSPGLGLEPGRGAVEGRVVNPEGAWVSGAHVLLVGGAFTTSDGQGAFRFTNLLPGPHLVRASADGYEPQERAVDVPADDIAHLQFVLDPAEDLGKDFRAHFHDFWNGQASKTLFEGDLEWPRGAADGGEGVHVCWGDALSGGSTVTLHSDVVVPSAVRNTCGLDFWLQDLADDGDDYEEIVWPGTSAIEVQVDWSTAQDYVTSVRFRYHPANASLFQTLQLVPGQVATIPVQSPMNDHGHQTYSLWGFRIEFDFVLKNLAELPDEGDLIRRLVGPFHVRMLAHKGVLEPEPAHPRFWAQTDRLTLLDASMHNLTTGPFIERDPTVAASDVGLNLPSGAVVPPGTTRLDVGLEYWSDTPGADLDEQFSEKRVAFRTGAKNPRLMTLADLRVDAPPATVRPTGGQHGRVDWALPVTPAEVDAYYQPRSLWLFLLANAGKERDEQFLNECVVTPACGEDGAHYRLTVAAVNENRAAELAVGRA